MSKITELRREATEAVRTRRFDVAVKLYERICGLDGTNPGYRNELGDVHIKMGDIPSGVSNFEKAIELYMAVGLTNNAVAVHKKILRFDPDRFDSHWGLGDIRRRQGLETEASSSFLDFLAQADKLSQHNREVFLDRCSLLIENMADDLQILSTLETIYERWEMPVERARVLVCKAKLAHESGELEVAGHYLARAKELSSDLGEVPEYAALLERMGPQTASAASKRPTGSPAPSGARPGAPQIERAAPAPSGPEAAAGKPQAAAGRPDSTVAKPPPAAAAPGAAAGKPGVEAMGHADGAPSRPSPPPSPPPPAPGLDTDVPDLELELEDVPRPNADRPAAAPAAGPKPAAASRARGPAANDATAPRDASPEPSLLDAILAGDAKVDLGRAEQEQVDTIVQDLQGQMGSEVAADDYKGQYDLGLVFMDMALYAQAVEAFTRAAAAEPIRLKALEMKGTCLRRMGRLNESLVSYREGLRVAGHPARHYLGLLYEAGSCLEELGRGAEALDHYHRVVAVDPGFLDVQERVARLQAARR